MNNKICGIYCIENTINNKKYIGQSINIYERFIYHKSHLKHNRHDNVKLQEEYNIYGLDNFKYYILEECTINNLDDKEKYYIQLYKSYINEYGYNIDKGGRFNIDISEEHCNKLSDTKKKILSDKNSKSYKNLIEGQKLTRKPIYQLNDNCEIIKEWKYGAIEIAETFNIEQYKIYNSCKTLNKTNGYYWVLKEKYSDKTISVIKNKKSKNNKVYQYDFNGNLINIWNNTVDVEKSIGISSSSVSQCCNNKFLQTKGFIWSYNEMTKEQILQKVKLIPKYVITRVTPDKEVV